MDQVLLIYYYILDTFRRIVCLFFHLIVHFLLNVFIGTNNLRINRTVSFSDLPIQFSIPVIRSEHIKSAALE